MPDTSGIRSVDNSTSTNSLSGAYSCNAFRTDPTLVKIVSGTSPAIAKGAKSPAVKTVQAALFSLGYLKPRGGIDGDFGSGTAAAIEAFQTMSQLPRTGQIDKATMQALDAAAARQIATLRAATTNDQTKRANFRIVADISNSGHTRLYVMGSNGKIEARYLTSPGSAAHPTRGDHFVIRDVFTRAPWNPPDSPWAHGAKPVPGGIDNPMGLTKLSFGQYSEYIHGIPASEEAALGKAASHGCLRVSGSNVLEIGEKYAGTGTDVTITRDRTTSARLEAEWAQSGKQERPTDAGREYMFGYVSGELGSTRHFNG